MTKDSATNLSHRITRNRMEWLICSAQPFDRVRILKEQTLKAIIGWVITASLLVALTLTAQPGPTELQDFLRKQLAVTPSELSALNTGQIIVRLPKTAETREVAAFAIMRLNVPSAFFLEKVRRHRQFQKERQCRADRKIQ